MSTTEQTRANTPKVTWNRETKCHFCGTRASHLAIRKDDGERIPVCKPCWRETRDWDTYE